MFDLRAREGDEFRAVDPTQGLPFLSPDAVSSLGDLVRTGIGDMHNPVGISVQQVTATDAHPGDRHLSSNAHTDGVAVSDDQSCTEVLKAAERSDFLDIAQAPIGKDTNGSQSLH